MMMEKTLEEVQKDVLTWYCNKLDAMQINNEYDLILYCSYAGRLSSLGVEKYMPTADKLLSEGQYYDQREQIFLDRIEQGIWDIQEQSGKELGICLTELQDMYCFFIHTTCSFSDKVQNQFSQWAEDGQYADVDADTIDYINDYLDANPLPQSDILSAIACPMPKEMYALEAMLSKLKNVQYHAEQKNNGWTFTNGIRTFELVSKSVVDNVRYIELYEITDECNIPAEGLTIRQDFLSAVQDAQNPFQWTIDYCPFPNVNLSSKKDEPLTVEFPAGGYCTVSVKTTENVASANDIADSLMIIPSYLSRFPGLATESTITRQYTMAAAESNKPVNLVLKVKQTDVVLDLYYDMSSKQATIEVYCESQPNTKSDKIDGWKVLGMKGDLLATIQDGCVTYTYTDFDVPVQLEDTVGKKYQLVEFKEN